MKSTSIFSLVLFLFTLPALADSPPAEHYDRYYEIEEPNQGRSTLPASA
ncbi:MAG: hypothetical protein HC902_06975 [Calothrix sp. SM1_5_4]|nr:hypothetical protein [Calothrix sp. SM1_5_4]